MITVLMPTYNCAAYISCAIRSILAQTHQNFEFLIIDDGSDDNTKEIVHSFIDPRIIYFQLEHMGVVSALNFGIIKASFDLIAIMHADDLAHPDLLKRSIFIRTHNPSLDIISCWYSCFKNKKILYNVKTPETHNDIVNGLVLYSLVCHPGCTFSKSKLLEFSHGYSASGGIEDYALWYQLKDHLIFYNIQEVLIFYRMRTNSLSRNNLIQYNKTIYCFQRSFYDKLPQYFGIDPKRINIYKGWREYFYGSPNLARKYWRSCEREFLKDYKILLAFLISFLPEKLFMFFKESQIRFRIHYLIEYFKKDNRTIRKTFKLLTSKIKYRHFNAQ